MEALNWPALVAATQGRLEGAPQASPRAVSTDSRALRGGELFVALEGPRFDGHDFALEALRAGAAGVVLRADHPKLAALPLGDAPRLLVRDTLRALGDIASAYAAAFAVVRIGITGSVGKTTVRGMIASILARGGTPHQNHDNHNNLVGVPQTLLGLCAAHDYLVAELGADRPGEIERLTEIVRPQVGVITAIGSSHLERFGSPEGIAREKSRLLAGLVGDQPVAVVPAHTRWTAYLLSQARGKAVTFGVADGADVWAEDIELDAGGNARFLLCTAWQQAVCYLNVPGMAAVSNALAAAAACLSVQRPLGEIVDGLERFVALAGRSTLHRLLDRDAVLLDGAYNASPESMESALETLAAIAARRRVAVLGDMLELGAESESSHRRLGEKAAAARVELLICVGEHARVTADAARAAGVRCVEWAADAEQARAVLDAQLKPGDAILVKGSHAIGLDRLVNHYTANKGERNTRDGAGA